LRFDSDAAQRETERACACLVEPLQVVDDQRDRVRRAELRQQTLDSQGYCQSVDLGSDRFEAVQSNRQRPSLRTRKVSVHSLRTLTDKFGKPREGQSSLELCRSDGKNPPPPALRQRGCDLQQAALPGTGIADGDRASTADEEVAHDAQSVLTAEQPRCGRFPVHDDIIP
jgi:hypothetical protein